MSVSAHLSRILVHGLPLAFLVVSWVISAGFPYYLDSNETYLSYLHARNLEIWDPWKYSWLTAAATDPERPTTEHVYSHNPNAPRYVHYLLLRLGVRDLSLHVLAIGLLATGLTTLLLWRLFGHPATVAVPLAVALDYAGFLAWTVNTYRVWTFVLFFGMALAIERGRPLWFGVLTFALFQVEYAMALMLGVTMCTLAVMLYGRRSWRLIAASATGAVLSLALFAVQVLTYHGWDGLMGEIAHTYARRGPEGATGGPGRYLFQSWHGLLLLLDTMALETYNRVVLVVIVAGLTIATVKLLRGRYDGPRRVLASLLLATSLGAMATSALLHSYFVDTYVVSLLPCGVFLVALATGVVAVEIYDVTARLSHSQAVASYACLAALLPVVAASVTTYRPPIGVEYMSLLRTSFRDQAIVGPTVGQWLFAPELAFALTGGRAAQTGSFEATPEDLERFAELRGPDGTLTYACLDTLYIRRTARSGDPSVCEVAEGRLVQRGHEVVADGFGWTVMRLYAEDRTTSAGVPDDDRELPGHWRIREPSSTP